MSAGTDAARSFDGMVARFRETAPALGVEVELHRGTADDLPVPGAALDAVVSGMALHRFPDEAGAVRAMARAVRPGGWPRSWPPAAAGTSSSSAFWRRCGRPCPSGRRSSPSSTGAGHRVVKLFGVARRPA